MVIRLKFMWNTWVTKNKNWAVKVEEERIDDYRELLYLVRDASIALLKGRRLGRRPPGFKPRYWNVELYWDENQSYGSIEGGTVWSASFNKNTGGNEDIRDLYQLLAFELPVAIYKCGTLGRCINRLPIPKNFVMIAPSYNMWPAVRIILNRNMGNFNPAKAKAIRVMAWDLAYHYAREMFIAMRLDWSKPVLLSGWPDDVNPYVSIIDIRFRSVRELTNILYSLFNTPYIPIEYPGEVTEYTSDAWFQLLLKTIQHLYFRSGNTQQYRAIFSYLRSL